MNFRIAICDDNIADTGFIQHILSHWGSSAAGDHSSGDVPLCRAFPVPVCRRIRLLTCCSWTLKWGGMDGVTMAKRIRRDDRTIQIVFLTGYSDYIAEGYEVAALHYLTKPVGEEKLFSVLDRAMERRQQNERYLNLELPDELVRIPFSEIRYLDVHQNYVTVHSQKEYTLKRTLSELEKQLDTRFFRIGRSIILNLGYVQRVTKKDVFLSDSTVLPLPRGAYEPLNRAIIAHT